MTSQTSTTQQCAHCGKPVPLTPRYPRTICDACRALLTDAAGRPVEFFNEDAFGGLIGFYAGTNQQEPYPALECYIGTAQFHAQEGRFGGVVIEAAIP